MQQGGYKFTAHCRRGRLKVNVQRGANRWWCAPISTCPEWLATLDPRLNGAAGDGGAGW